MASDAAMTCDAVRPLLREATRGALDPAQQAGVDAHLTTCAECRQVAAEERALDRLLIEGLPQYPASLALKRRLRARLPAVPPAPARRPRRAWVGMGAALAACAVVVIVAVRRPPQAADPLVAEGVADHLRVVARERPVDVENGGPHQVRPWFTGRLDFALPFVFGGDGEYTLVGGSVGYYLDRKSAVLVYRRGLHVASLSVFPAAGLAFPAPAQDAGGVPVALRQERGFRVALWRQGELGYALVSDLSSDEILGLASRIARGR
ncbi:MAG TPA: zf-HC2 domain-containing protein [Polyangia bacterium]|nr:zf-HC2 domain-containing protein [Polyangia bacterium]